MLWVFVLLLLLLFVMSLYPSGKWFKVKPRPSNLTVYYGAPGSGKTTYAAWLARKYINCGYKVYSNVPIKDCIQFSKNDLGTFKIGGQPSLLIYDESGIDLNNRNFKSNFTQSSLEWWKKHRHELVEVAVFSQGWDDMDKKVRTLATDMRIVRRVGRFVLARKVKKRPDIDEFTKQPIDAYFFVPFASKWIYGPSVWNTFDSFEPIPLPDKDFPIYK